MRVLVTGGAGFIGSHATEALVREGWSVVGLDSLDPYYDVAIKRRNLAAASGPRFTFVEGDIRNRALVDESCGKNALAAIVHAAIDTGRSIELDAFIVQLILERAGAINLAWLESGRPQLRIAINLTPASLLDDRSDQSSLRRRLEDRRVGLAALQRRLEGLRQEMGFALARAGDAARRAGRRVAAAAGVVAVLDLLSRVRRSERHAAHCHEAVDPATRCSRTVERRRLRQRHRHRNRNAQAARVSRRQLVVDARLPGRRAGARPGGERDGRAGGRLRHCPGPAGGGDRALPGGRGAAGPAGPVASARPPDRPHRPRLAARRSAAARSGRWRRRRGPPARPRPRPCRAAPRG